MSDTGEELKAVRDVLRKWDDEHEGNLRVELRLVSKHTGPVEVPPTAAPLGLLLFEIDEALKALAFVNYLKNLGREIMHP